MTPHPLGRQPGIIDFLIPLAANLRQPVLERLRLGRGNGLNDAQKALRIAHWFFSTACHLEQAIQGEQLVSQWR